jgi:hypothetical protein
MIRDSKKGNRVQSANTKTKFSKAIGIPVKVIEMYNEVMKIFIEKKKEESKYLNTCYSTLGLIYDLVNYFLKVQN